MPLDFQHDTLILDASCIITLYASQQMPNILSTVSSLVTVAFPVPSLAPPFRQVNQDGVTGGTVWKPGHSEGNGRARGLIEVCST